MDASERTLPITGVDEFDGPIARIGLQDGIVDNDVQFSQLIHPSYTVGHGDPAPLMPGDLQSDELDLFRDLTDAWREAVGRMADEHGGVVLHCFSHYDIYQGERFCHGHVVTTRDGRPLDEWAYSPLHGNVSKVCFNEFARRYAESNRDNDQRFWSWVGNQAEGPGIDA